MSKRLCVFLCLFSPFCRRSSLELDRSSVAILSYTMTFVHFGEPSQPTGQPHIPSFHTFRELSSASLGLLDLCDTPEADNDVIGSACWLKGGYCVLETVYK